MGEQLTADMVSDFFIKKSIKADNPAGVDITHMKLQRLVTYAYVWHLGLRGERLFEEKIKKSHHGYTVKSQFERFKPFGFMPIILPDFEYKHELSYSMEEFLENLWDVYGRFEASYLSKLQCREIPYKESEAFFIDDKSIKEFYTRKNKELGWYLPEGVCFSVDDQDYLPIICFTPDQYRECLPSDIFD